MLALGPDLFVPADETMPRVMTGHQAGTGRGTNGAGRIKVSHFHSLFRHPVHMRSLKFFLTETGKVSIPGIIHHDINKIRFLGQGHV